MRDHKLRYIYLASAALLTLAAIPTAAQQRPERVQDGAILKSPVQSGFVGIGVQLDPKLSQDGYAVVRMVIQRAGADVKASLRPGDKITRIDGQSVRNASINQVVGLIRGEEGTPVRLTVLRAGAKKPVDATVKRRAFRPLIDDSQFQ